MTRGFLLGKFFPPHNGHLLLCDFAQNLCDELTILVCALEGDTIPGPLRVTWMQELCPRARIAYLDENVPQAPENHPHFWDIWRNIVRRFHPETIDLVFASEPYGLRLAREVSARFVPFDFARAAISSTGTAARHSIFAQWDALPMPVRAHYAKTICLFGPESSGKTTLTALLAAEFQTIAVPELGRTYTEVFGLTCSAEDLRNIADAQSAAIAAAKRYANRIVLSDTDALLTSVWREMLQCPGQFSLPEGFQPADLYLLTGVDFPWENDGTRYFPDARTREIFYARCKKALEERQLPFVELTGSTQARKETAAQAIRKLIAQT